MKVIVIEGSAAEMAEYEAQTGLVGQAIGLVSKAGLADGPIPAPAGEVITGDGFDRRAEVRAFITSRARTKEDGDRVNDYIGRVQDVEDVVIEIGKSRARQDGHGDSLLIYDTGPRHYGAVAYVSAKNAGLTLRLRKEDVVDVSDRLGFRDVKPSNVYRVTCPLRHPDAVELAVMLTRRALRKIRRTE